MTTLEQVQQLIEELGPATSEVAAVQQSDEASWEAAFADDTIVQIEFDEGRQTLVFTADLGPLPSEQQAASLMNLMIFNGAWTATGGLRMGLDAPDGHVLLMFDLSAAALSLQTLQDYLSAFANHASTWQAVIPSGFGSIITGAAGGEFHESALPSGIRV